MNALSVLKIPFIYISIGAAWILFNDFFISSIGLEEETFAIWEKTKSWLFILVTGLILAILLYKHKKLGKVEQNRDELSALINAMSDFIVLKDAQGRWTQLNDYGYKLYHLNKEHYTGKSDLELADLYPEYREHFLYCAQSDEKVWESEFPMQIEERMESENGVRIFDVIKVPLFTENGKRKAFFVIGRDITDMKRAEEMLVKNEKLSVVGQLAAGIAHEIRNPLTSLKGFVQLCRENPEAQKDFYFNIMHMELERINQIVNELLLIAKPQKLSFERHHIGMLLKNVHNIMNTEAMLNGVTILLHNEPNLPYITCEENQLKQVFINILKNAIEASKEGDTIHVFAKKSGTSHVSIIVQDEGVGISKERLLKIGEPFYTMKEKGTGLGMTVTYKIIQSHQGSINIESELGQGTTVKVNLPIQTKPMQAES